MKVLFLGYAVGLDIAEKFSGISIAGNKMQVNVLKELASYKDVDLKIISIAPVAAFPHDKHIFIKQEEINISSGIRSTKIAFLNFPIIKQVWQTIAIYNMAKIYADKETTVFTFNLFPQVGLPAMWLKKKYKCCTCSLLADLPIDDKIGSKNFLRNFLRKVFDILTKKAIINCDKLIVLNEQAITDFAPNTKNYIVVEGGIEVRDLPSLKRHEKKRKNIIYSGALTEYSGVLTLIDAMKYVDDKDVILEIYGSGYLCDYIKEIVSESRNIRYCGKVSNTEMLLIQRNAYLLVNPRPVDDSIARVTFPSKIFEYMISGSPVLSTKLNGLTEEYLEHLFLVEDFSSHAFADKINEIMGLSQDVLYLKAINAFNFIVQKKNWNRQCNKIYKFLKQENLNEGNS